MKTVKSEARAILSEFLRREIGARAAHPWAIKVGLPSQDVRRALHGTTGMSIDKLQQFAEALGVEAWQLLKPGFERPRDAFPAMSVEAIDTARRIDMIEDEAKRRLAVAAVANLLELASSSPIERPAPAPAAPTRSASDTTPKLAVHL